MDPLKKKVQETKEGDPAHPVTHHRGSMNRSW